MTTNGLSLLLGLLLLPCSAVSLGIFLEPADECANAEPDNLKQCYEAVTWALEEGIKAHPEWYPDVNLEKGVGHFSKENNFKSVQASLHNRRKAGCPRPCPRARAVATTKTTTEAPLSKVDSPVEIRKRVADMSVDEVQEYIKGSMSDAAAQHEEAVQNMTAERVASMPADEVEQTLQGNTSNASAQSTEAAENASSDVASSPSVSPDTAENARAPTDEVRSLTAWGKDTPAAEEAQRPDAERSAAAPAEGPAGPADAGPGTGSDEPPRSVDNEPLPSVDNDQVEVVAPTPENEGMRAAILENGTGETSNQSEPIMGNVAREMSEGNETDTEPLARGRGVSEQNETDTETTTWPNDSE